MRGGIEGRKEEGKDSRGEDHLSVRRRTVTSRLQDGTALDCLGRAKFSSQGGARLGRSQSAGTYCLGMDYGMHSGTSRLSNEDDPEALG
ncbi:uncharacterized protein BO87DRAFT_439841 [Aspergillus neoniger CBS 115656]|uniref:Uncharacterized protein n=1 Tax=Aspergillus neoniger (strain CBS 115656) TaxID=1448310 RepID=A0A318YKD2_ASPNB|nr:hypothetical protein BO87DRAFT_439841 [Aspergillus neoniger CBS 115656]PYH32910.1 hypothetical protein BO87DRAFT_439841 [Aspergillus neoniger CBS 115656]